MRLSTDGFAAVDGRVSVVYLVGPESIAGP